MHFGKIFGGLSFYNSNYRYTTINGKSALHWITTSLTDKIFHEHTHILEINSKTGLYPLYATTSLYYQAFNKMNENTAGKFSLIDEQNLERQYFCCGQDTYGPSHNQKNLGRIS